MRTILILAVLALTASAAEPTDSDRLRESLAKWEKARDAAGGDYVVTVRWSSAFGFGNSTTITIKANKVVERKFDEFGQPEPGKAPAAKQKWVEMGKDIGSHKEGAAACTVDELYAEAKKVLEKELPATHVRSIGFDKATGLLSYCFVRDKRIADDAPLEGVRPFAIQLTPQK